MAMKEALKDRDVSECLISQFREDCNSKIAESKREIIEHIEEKMEEKLTVIDEKNTEQDDRLTALEKWVDNSEQDTRGVNMIVRGLNTTHGQTEEDLVNLVASTLSRKLEVKLHPNDIRYVIILGKEEKDVNRPVKVIFHERRARDFIFRKRSLLRGTNVWLGDDLTAKRSKLAYHARQAAKLKEEYKTWTFDGRVYFKMDDAAEPTRIDDVADLPTA